MKVFPSIKIYLDNSPVHGWGVFASQNLVQDEIIEVCPIIDMEIPKGEGNSMLMNYRYNWPQGTSDWDKQVISVGFSLLYNHNDTPNAGWRSNMETNCFEFYALREINKDEEIFIYYGGSEYWNDGRTNIKII
jgi:SET domain-containing protein